VERLEQRGFRVADICMEQFEELLWTRSFLEEKALRESIRHGDRAWEERLVLSLYHLRKYPMSGGLEDDAETETWESFHAQFHRDLISGCPSRLLLQYCAELYDANRRYRHIARLTSRTRAEALSEHEAIGTATLARDADTAARLLIEHYNRTGDLLREHLSQYRKAG
jgi:DNA-binding GntR family transcriptional regulator